MKRGLKSVLLFYGIGFCLAGLVYLIFGHPYIHVPGLPHFIIVGTILTGFVGNLADVILYFFKSKTEKRKWRIIFNSIILLSFAMIIFTMFMNLRGH